MHQRLNSLDQFRGYVVLGMFFVNFAGHFAAIPAVFKHHNTYCSYADTIMPHFFFAAGMALSLTYRRRREKSGTWRAVQHVIERSLALILLGAVVYHLDGKIGTWEQWQQMTLTTFLAACKRSLFQTLVHIGVTTLWILPVLAAPGWVRGLYALGSGLLHLLLSFGINGWSNYVWVNTDPRGIDGGPLGFLTWTIPMIAGTLVMDWLRLKPEAQAKDAPARTQDQSVGLLPHDDTEAAILRWRVRLQEYKPQLHVAVRLMAWGIALMMAGYALEMMHLTPQPLGGSLDETYRRFVPPPFVFREPEVPPSILVMSQRAGSITYLTFATGLSMVLYALFVLACDVGGWQIGLLRTLGTNALAGYLIHGFIDDAIKPWTPKDAPLWFALLATLFFLLLCYVFLRFLEKRGLYLRL